MVHSLSGDDEQRSSEDADSALPATPYQSLYRRFRPQRFADVRGQEHVTRALLNSVREGRIAHAYLFSGPRGTGKTSTARILAMALNCEHPTDGEPDSTCASCVDIRRGVSVDVQELDAASNRRIDEMRDLLSRVALGTRGRWKVYIIDEVHQLTADAASALLKTLEEPPAHVVFVLATTDPQKVLPTIRSRTIPFDFHLLPSDVLGGLVRDINEQAHLGVPSEAIDLVIRRGHGSARDALTVLDQVAAGGGTEDQAVVVAEIVDALAARDTGLALTAVAEGMAAGRDARRLATDLLEHLRNGFLATMSQGLVMLPDDAVAEVAAQARRLGLAALVRAMEVIGQALTDMRDSVDPRVTLEVALVRLTRPDADISPAALLERIERLERGARSGEGTVTPVPVRPRPAPGGPSAGAGPSIGSSAGSASPPPRDVASQGQASQGAGPAPQPEAASSGARSRSGAPVPPPPVPSSGDRLGGPGRTTGGRGSTGAPMSDASGIRAPAASTARAPIAGRADSPVGVFPTLSLPTRDELTKAWGDGVLRSLSGKAKAYLQSGRFVGVDPDGAVFALPNEQWVSRSQDVRAEAETALAARFGGPVPLKLVVETAAGAPVAPATRAPEEPFDPAEFDHLQDAEVEVVSPEQRLLEAFPGAEEVST